MDTKEQESSMVAPNREHLIPTQTLDTTSSNPNKPSRYIRSAAVGLSLAALAACSSTAEGYNNPTSSATGKDKEVEQPQTETPPVEERTPEASPSPNDIPEISETEGDIDLEYEEGMDRLFAIDRFTYEFTIGDETYTGADSAIASQELLVGEFPARSEEGREELAKAFLDVVYDINYNGGLTEHEISNFEGSSMLGVNDERPKPIDILRERAYEPISIEALGLDNHQSFLNSVRDRATTQAENYRNTAGNDQPALASFELVKTGIVHEFEERVGPDRVGIEMYFNDNDGFGQELKGLYVIFAPKSSMNADNYGKEVWEVASADWIDIYSS